MYHEGRLALAEQQLRSVLIESPDHPDAMLLLGIILVRSKRFEVADPTLEKVLELRPDDFDALNWWAICKKERGDYTTCVSLCKRANAIRPENPAAFNTLGLALLDIHDSPGAIEAFSRAVDLNPKSGPALHNLGRAYAQSYRTNEALAAFRRAAELTPAEVSNYIEIYRQCELLGAWNEAKTVLEQGVKHNPASVQVLIALAKTYAELQEHEKAERHFLRALKLDPRSGQGYALWLQQAGRFEESVQQLLEIIKLEPNQGLAYYYLAEAKAFDQPKGSLIQSVREVERTPGLDSRSQMFLAYAQAKAFENEKQYQEAMQCFDRANDLAYGIYCAGRNYNASRMAEARDRIQSIVDRQFLESSRKFGHNSSEPIFVIGMIRSGTTLVDQIISSHPTVSSAGELPFWSQFADVTLNSWIENGLDLSRIEVLANEYLKQLHRMAPGNPRTTDKMPINFDYLGLIHAAFPRAKFVHVKRNPLDTCLSIYTTHFGAGPPFAYNKRNIVDHYRHYLSTMEYWKQLLPVGALCEVEYEELIGDPEPNIRELIGFLNLDWSEECLNHDKQQSKIMTPSRWQARQPIYRSSKDRWRRYEPWLGELLELQEVVASSIPTYP